MDEHLKRQIHNTSVWRGVLLWLFHRPVADHHVTPVDRCVGFLARIGMPLIVVVVSITFYEVVMRYVFLSPTLWVNEMTLWLGSVIFLISGVHAMQQRRHIRITAVYDIAPVWLKKIFDVVTVLVILVYAGILVIAGFPSAWDALSTWERLGTVWNPPVPATVKPLIIIATVLVALQAVVNLAVDTFGWRGFGAKRGSYQAQGGDEPVVK